MAARVAWRQVKRALWGGGIARANKAPEKRATPGLRAWDDLVGQQGGRCTSHRTAPHRMELLLVRMDSLRSRERSGVLWQSA